MRLARRAGVVPVNTNATGGQPSRPVAGYTCGHNRYLWTSAPKAHRARSASVFGAGSSNHARYRRSFATSSSTRSVPRSTSTRSTGTPASGARTTRSAYWVYPYGSLWAASVSHERTVPNPAPIRCAAVEVATAACASYPPAPRGRTAPVPPAGGAGSSADIRTCGGSSAFASAWPRGVRTHSWCPDGSRVSTRTMPRRRKSFSVSRVIRSWQ